MFGGRICGSANTVPASNSTSGNTTSGDTDDTIFNNTLTKREGEAMMAWFLRRWAPLPKGLFDVIDDAKMGIVRRPPDGTVSERTSLSPDLWPTLSSVDHRDKCMRKIGTSANAPEGHAEEGWGGGLFEKGEGDGW